MTSEWRVAKILTDDGGCAYEIFRYKDGKREDLGRVFDDPELAEDVCRIKNEEEE